MFYSLVAISLMALDYRGQYVERLRNIATQLAEPIFLAVDLPFSSFERITHAWRKRADAERRIAGLELELSRARARLGRLDDLEAENAQLRGLLDTTRRTEQEFIAAEIASVDLDSFAHRIMVRGGRKDGIHAGMPVIDSSGVLGQVEQALNGMAQVILISDPDHALPVQILPGGERTIVYGSGAMDQLRLTDLPMNAQVSPDDLIVTSGIGGRFPPGLPVARIDSVQRQSGQPFATAFATPLAAMDRNRLVLILKPVPRPDGRIPQADDHQTGQDHGQPNRSPSGEAPDSLDEVAGPPPTALDDPA
ncbi:MAG TPA: rod shape-determining protein MreC [Wenzhouxiangellaceae bacterium]|nr:rod shape-determining protein MreC [Wenzhouxiangellaceae bacterium]